MLFDICLPLPSARQGKSGLKTSKIAGQMRCKIIDLERSLWENCLTDWLLLKSQLRTLRKVILLAGSLVRRPSVLQMMCITVCHTRIFIDILLAANFFDHLNPTTASDTHGFYIRINGEQSPAKRETHTQLN